MSEGYGRLGRLAKKAVLAGGLYALLRNRLRDEVFPPGAVRSRHPDDLNLGIPPSDDGAHPSPKRAYFEWWYFDACFDDGHTLVGVIMDPDAFGYKYNETQVYIHINTPDGEQYDVRENHPRTEYSSSTETCDVSCAGSTIVGSYPDWRIDLEAGDLAAHLDFHSLLPGWARGGGRILFGSYLSPAEMGWVVPQPRARVTGTITYDGRTHEVEGEGYHDHNWGEFNIPLKVSRWHWGRITTPELTLVFADVATNFMCARVHVPMLLLARGDRLALETYEMEWEYDDWAFDSGGTQLYARRISFRFAERDVSGRIEFRPKEELETNDFFEQMGMPRPLREPMARFVTQPYYVRALTDYEGEIDFGGDVVPLSGETIMEYILFNRRRGSAPTEKRYAHFLHPR